MISFEGVEETTTFNFTVNVFDDDTLEGNESYILTISSSVGIITSPNTTEVIIIDNEGRLKQGACLVTLVLY